MSENTTVQFTGIPGHPVFTADYLARRFAAVLQANNDTINANALAAYDSGVAAWFNNASHNRDLGLPAPAKPQQPVGILLSFSFSPPAATSTLTIVSTEAPLGVPCPDLPPLSSAATFVLGPPQDPTNPNNVWFLVGPGDQEPVGLPVTAPDGHVYVKYQFFGGSQLYWRKS